MTQVLRHGRSDREWGLLIDASRHFLVEHTRKQRTTSYTELNAVLGQRTSVRTFDFDLASERAALGELLGEVSLLERAACGHLISSIVLYLNDNSAGPGFFNLAVAIGLLPGDASSDQKLVFWNNEVKAVFAHYGPTRRRG